jgi:hypothetical protein
MTRATARGILLIITALTAASLSGCAPSVVPLSTTPTVPPSQSPTPTPSVAGRPTPTRLPANALFQINAVATASNGAIVDLVETAYLPTTATAAQIALLNAQCNYPGDPAAQGQPSWITQYPATVYMHVTITATPRTGTPAWPNKSDPVVFSYIPVSAYHGAYSVNQPSCTAGIITVYPTRTSTVHGVAPLAGGDPAHGAYGWATLIGTYGFNNGNGPGGPNPGTAVVSHCAVQLSATAIAAGPKVAAWASQTVNNQGGCAFTG